MPNKSKDLEQFDIKRHKCPKCGESSLLLITPESLKRESSNDERLTGSGDSFRLMCNNCKYSSKNHPTIWGVISEWVSIKNRFN